MKPIKKTLDKLVQLACLNKKCVVCGKNAECGHHIVRRDDPMCRYDPINILPLCYECHWAIHEDKIKDWQLIDKERVELLRELQRMSYKDFLIFVAMKTENEYLQGLKEYWKEKI